MTKDRKINYTRQTFDDIKSLEGLPENISTEAQLWDEILKNEAFRMPDYFFPLIKEIHGKTYPSDTSIKPLATEYSVERSETKEITSIHADITIIVAGHDIYHFECEISNDHTMVLRMFEYDVHMALSYHVFPENPLSEMTLRFPNSAVLYLQDNGNIPDELLCKIRFADGGSYEYKVPTLKVQSYSLEEIQKKHLCILIPFLPLRFRKRLDSRVESRKPSKEELTSFFDQLILILDKEVLAGSLSEMNRRTILSLLSKSMIRVFYKDESLLKEVLNMTAPVLETEFDVLETEFDELTRKFSKLSTDFDNLDSEYNQLETEYHHLDTEYGNLKSNYGNLETEYGNLKSNYGNLETEYGNLETEYGNLETEYGNLETEYGNLETEYGNLETEYGNLETEYGNLETEYGNLETEYGNLETEYNKQEAYYTKMIADMKTENTKKDAELESLKKQLAKLQTK